MRRMLWTMRGAAASMQHSASHHQRPPPHGWYAVPPQPHRALATHSAATQDQTQAPSSSSRAKPDAQPQSIRFVYEPPSRQLSFRPWKQRRALHLAKEVQPKVDITVEGKPLKGKMDRWGFTLARLAALLALPSKTALQRVALYGATLQYALRADCLHVLCTGRHRRRFCSL